MSISLIFSKNKLIQAKLLIFSTRYLVRKMKNLIFFPSKEKVFTRKLLITLVAFTLKWQRITMWRWVQCERWGGGGGGVTAHIMPHPNGERHECILMDLEIKLMTLSRDNLEG